MDFRDLATKFAAALVARDFSHAHAMLADTLLPSLTVECLEQAFNQMVSGQNGLAIETMETLTDWPGKQAKDLGWAYVAISNATRSEAVTVIVCLTHRGPAIRDIVWGRP